MATVATTYTMARQAVEESTYTLPIAAFYDDATTPAAITPASITWSLHNGDDDVVNSRDTVVVTAATSINITLTGDDLALPDEAKSMRYVTLEYTYDSTLGTGLPGKQQIAFRITPLGTVT